MSEKRNRSSNRVEKGGGEREGHGELGGEEKSRQDRETDNKVPIRRKEVWGVPQRGTNIETLARHQRETHSKHYSLSL